MYRWYENSERCYSYLHDVHESAIPDDRDEKRFPESHGWPKWFSRGWTLQELVAPKVVHFFNKEWDPVGDKSSLSSTLTKITRIPANILANGLSSKQPSVAQIISWAADRRTTREEDKAYSLLGLLGVHIPMLYGEGKNAFRRLQLEIIRKSNDQSIFAWGHTRTTGCSGSFLADDPSYFRDCSEVERMEREEFIASVRGDTPEKGLSDLPEERLRTFSVTNDGIQIWLPLTPCRRAMSVFEARLACRSCDSQPITIILARFQSIYTFLPYQVERCRGDFIFELDVQMLSHDGFVQHVVFPHDVVLTDNSLTLSGTNDCAVIVFEREEDNARFALVLSYGFGQHSVHAIICKSAMSREDFAAHVYRNTRRGDLDTSCPLHNARQRAISKLHSGRICLVKHVHLPQSIQVVRMIYGKPPRLSDGCTVSIDITQCTGCCAPIWEELDGVRIFFWASMHELIIKVFCSSLKLLIHQVS
ncbi:hypothetical protein ID866_8512 [Astraeus odoratus]|nr:hypothetical protein ID866_8512 [Astraeus odoratus]